MVLLCKNIVQLLAKQAFRFLKSKNFVKAAVMITVNCVLQTLKVSTSFTMAMLSSLGQAVC